MRRREPRGNIRAVGVQLARHPRDRYRLLVWCEHWRTAACQWPPQRCGPYPWQELICGSTYRSESLCAPCCTVLRTAARAANSRSEELIRKTELQFGGAQFLKGRQ